ncbi:hypothetical protein GCM10009630_02290 [Kribbella jejuensis]|uniref:Uncharacterized protein n=1 Tax=Kribbella jejuensis TaxID=236068 RepID=A0A542EUM6_9ACTN|nr:hypothetical protein [Kribbella jejuensis]TQJ19061.1 hypothetical protein FB475_3218 [Kribbella jejuensis]
MHGIVAAAYLGIPVLLLVVVAVIAASGPAAAWIGCVVPLGMLVLGFVLRRRHRYQPRWWTGVAGLFGGLTGLMVTLFPLAVGVWWPAVLALPGLILGIVAGLALARAADRALLVPFVPELASTPYELVFRLRGIPLAAVLVGADDVTIQSHPVPRSDQQSRSYPLTAITGSHEFSLSGAERLKFPIAISHAAATAGPAVILQANGEDWVLPTNQASTLIDVLTVRRADQPG